MSLQTSRVLVRLALAFPIGCGAAEVSPSLTADDASTVARDAASADAATAVLVDAAASTDGGPAAATDTGLVVQPAGCTDVAGNWDGTISGNDPNVATHVSLIVAPDCTTVSGRLEWRSVNSGSVDRVLAGTWTPASRALVLHDVSLESVDNMPAWRFCLVDHYDLVLGASGTTLSGTYVSFACDDHARVELHR